MFEGLGRIRPLRRVRRQTIQRRVVPVDAVRRGPRGISALGSSAIGPCWTGTAQVMPGWIHCRFVVVVQIPRRRWFDTPSPQKRNFPSRTREGAEDSSARVVVVECEVKRRNVATDVHVCTLYNIYAYYVCIHGCTGADAGPVVLLEVRERCERD